MNVLRTRKNILVSKLTERVKDLKDTNLVKYIINDINLTRNTCLNEDLGFYNNER